MAREAGVSLATVDRVVNRRPGVRERTVARVEAAILKLSYRPDPAAARLARNRSFRFCFILPDGSNAFMDLLADQVRQTAEWLAGQRAFIDTIHVDVFDPDVLATALETEGPRFDGVATIALDHPRVRDAIDDLTRAGVAVVTLVSDAPASRRLHYVGIDNTAAGRTAGTLMGRFLGEKKGVIGVIAGSLALRDHAERQYWIRPGDGQGFPAVTVLQARESRDDSARTMAITEALLAEHANLVGPLQSRRGQPRHRRRAGSLRPRLADRLHRPRTHRACPPMPRARHHGRVHQPGRGTRGALRRARPSRPLLRRAHRGRPGAHPDRHLHPGQPAVRSGGAHWRERTVQPEAVTHGASIEHQKIREGVTMEFKPENMQVGILSAALQELTPRDKRRADPDLAVEDWIAYAARIGVKRLQISSALPEELADVPAEAMLDPVADHLNVLKPLDASRVNRIQSALKASGVSFSDIGYFDNMLIGDAKSAPGEARLDDPPDGRRRGAGRAGRLRLRGPQCRPRHGPEPRGLRGALHPAPEGGHGPRPRVPRRAVPDARLEHHGQVAQQHRLHARHVDPRCTGSPRSTECGDAFRIHYDPSHAILMGQNTRDIFQFLKDEGYDFLIGGFHVKGQVCNPKGVAEWGYGGQTADRGDRKDGKPNPGPAQAVGAWLKQVVLCTHELPGTARHDPLAYLQNRTVDWLDHQLAARELLKFKNGVSQRRPGRRARVPGRAHPGPEEAGAGAARARSRSQSAIDEAAARHVRPAEGDGEPGHQGPGRRPRGLPQLDPHRTGGPQGVMSAQRNKERSMALKARTTAAGSGGKIRLGMVGGGEGAFIGAVHRLAARMDDHYTFVAGALSYGGKGQALGRGAGARPRTHVWQTSMRWPSESGAGRPHRGGLDRHPQPYACAGRQGLPRRPAST